jgi:hypothetical protein
MRDEYYDLLIKKFGESNNSRPPDTAVLEKYKAVMPSLLIGYWQTEGFCQFRNGLMFTINPDDWQPVVDAWLKNTPYEQFGRFYAISRTAFGMIRLFNEKIGTTVVVRPLMAQIDSRNVRTDKTAEDLANSVGIALTRMPEDLDFYDDQDELLFDRAVAKLGPVGWNEMFAFEPALVLGGKPTLDNLTKLDWRVHLQLLRSLQAPHVPFTQINVPKSALEP